MQQKVTSIRAAEEFDATYAWKMGGRVIINLSSGKKISATVHGQKGSMHDPLEAPELAAKFSRLTQGRVNPKLEELLWSIDDAEDLTGLAATLRQSTNG